jgi:hypothetical protein
MKPDDAEVFNNCGMAKNALGQHRRAIEDYGHAIRLNETGCICIPQFEGQCCPKTEKV